MVERSGLLLDVHMRRRVVVVVGCEWEHRRRLIGVIALVVVAVVVVHRREYQMKRMFEELRKDRMVFGRMLSDHIEWEWYMD
jgi:hypothetical protein